MSADATTALVRAIEACDEAWRDRWERRPRARELVHAFEICLVSAAEDLVSDVDDCLAMMFPERPAPEPEERKRIRPMDLEVTFGGRPSQWEPESARVWLRELGEQRGLVLELLLQMAKPPRETTLIVDYKNPGGLTTSELRSGFKGRIAPRYIALRKVTIDRFVLRPLEGLDDPFEVELD